MSVCAWQIAHLQATIEALKSSKEEQGKKIETLAQKLKEVHLLPSLSLALSLFLTYF